MGHVLFAAPNLLRFHLHERLARLLRSRGHRVSVLAADPAAARVWAWQGLPARELRPGHVVRHRVPLDELAIRDVLLAGRPGDVAARRERARAALERRLLALFRMFETDAPDLVFVHGERSGLHRLIAFLAREYGCHVLHTGEGLLPGTMQRDEEGIDGDAAICRRRAIDYRRVRRDESMLAAALSAWLAGSRPPPLARKPVAPPPMFARLGHAFHHVVRGRPRAAVTAFELWRRARGPTPAPVREGFEPPSEPFVVVLLQHPRCPRILLDAEPGLGDPRLLGRATVRAVRALDPAIGVVGVLPERGLPGALCSRLAAEGLSLAPHAAAPRLLVPALATVTVNHPLGLAALLTRTPLLHLGRSPYGVEGVATRTSRQTLEDDLRRALEAGEDALRERFLTRMLTLDHLWCCPDAPDQNGLAGLAASIENRMQGGASGDPLTYRAGPAWPLQAGR